MINLNYFLIILILLATSSSLKAQGICNLHSNSYPDQIEEKFSSQVSFDSTAEARNFISKIMKTVQLPMNFHVHECSEIKCKNKNNAYATTDKDGTRFIVYDNDWFKGINSDTLGIESLTVLAHEIGHHLAGHTLNLNKRNYINAVNIHQKKLKARVITQVQYIALIEEENSNYLHYSRKQEIQADRIAGYIMSLMGYNLNQIQKVFSTQVEGDDSKSTHPSKNKRLSAVEYGFNKAIGKTASKINIEEIIGNPIDIGDTNKSKTNRNELIAQIISHSSTIPIRHIDSNSEDKISFLSGAPLPQMIIDRTNKYIKGLDKYLFRDTENEYFAINNYTIWLIYNKSVRYCPYTAIHIKDNTLKIISFEDQEVKILYTSKFNQSLVSLEEIKTIFVRLYESGLRNSNN